MRLLPLATMLLLASATTWPQPPRPPVQQTRPAKKEPSPAQQKAVGAKPQWADRGDTEDAQNAFFVGVASSKASESEAKRAALAAAIDKAVARAAEQLFADASTTTSYGVDALRQYVQKVSRVNDTWTGGGSA